MDKTVPLHICWNDDNDSCMTRTESADETLAEFFRVYDWEFVRRFFPALNDEKSVVYKEKSLEFKDTRACISIGEQHVCMDKVDLFILFHRLFDLMIIGANEDHHSVRYEPWWQEFTQASTNLEYKIQLEEELQDV